MNIALYCRQNDLSTLFLRLSVGFHLRLDHRKCCFRRLRTHHKLWQEHVSAFKSFSYRIKCRYQIILNDIQRLHGLNQLFRNCLCIFF